jgi:hypothetical protein
MNDPGEKTERFIVLWFSPSEDGRRVFTTEAGARKFAGTEDIAEWNPILERQTITTISEVLTL